MVNDRKFEGNYPAVVTPFNEKGELMIDDFTRIVRWHIDQGVDGIFIAGDNGEGWALTYEERKILAEAAVKVAEGRIAVVMGVNGISAKKCIRFAEIAADAGVDAMVLSAQRCIMHGTRKEIISRYISVYEAVPLPVLVYDIPSLTGINIDLETLGALYGAVPVIGIKESSRDFLHITKVIRDYGEKLSVFIGPGWFIFPGISLGARGFISTGPELFGKKSADIRKMAIARPSRESRNLHYRIALAYSTLLGTSTPPAALKAALSILGLPAGLPREPVQPLEQEELNRVKEMMKQLELIP